MMIETLEVLIDDFPGATNQTCYFLHVINLMVKSIIKQFDLPNSKKTSGDDEDDGRLDEATEELLKLTGDVKIEGNLMVNGEEDNDNRVG